jgi:hypothetical protein
MKFILYIMIAVAVMIFLRSRRSSALPAPAPKKRPLLSANADSRLRGLERLRDTALTQLDENAKKRWSPRLDEIIASSTRLLLMLDANKTASPRRTEAVQQLDQLQDVMEEIARAPLEGRDPGELDQRLIELNALAGTLKES